MDEKNKRKMPVSNVLFVQAQGVLIASTHVKSQLGMVTHTCSQNTGVGTGEGAETGRSCGLAGQAVSPSCKLQVQ